MYDDDDFNRDDLPFNIPEDSDDLYDAIDQQALDSALDALDTLESVVDQQQDTLDQQQAMIERLTAELQDTNRAHMAACLRLDRIEKLLGER